MKDRHIGQNEYLTSVVIATLNGALFIEEQLESIVGQTILPDEIIISDDGSTDNTEEIIHEFIKRHQNKKTQFVFCKNDSVKHGVTSNFENAIKKAQGEYIFLCDQDDVWEKNKIETIVDVLANHKEINVVFHDAEVIEKDAENSFHRTGRHLIPSYPFDETGMFQPDGKNEVYQLLHLWGIINGMCICAKREYLCSILPLSEGAYHDQWILFCGFTDHCVLAVNKSLALYRDHGHNAVGLSGFSRTRSFGQRVRSLCRFNKRAKERILAYYVWYKDTVDYSGESMIDEGMARRVEFFTKDRLTALSAGKMKGILMLYRAKSQGLYRRDEKVIFLLDLACLLLNSKRKRRQYVDSLDGHLRSLKQVSFV